MSDEQQDLNLEDVGATAEEAGGARGGGLLSGMLLNVLKWAAIAVAVIILVVATTVFTYRILSKGGSPQGLAALSPAYQAKSDPLTYTDSIEQVRGATSDETPAIFVVKVSLGYTTGDKQVGVEIGQRQREIQDLILKLVSMKTAAELTPAHFNEIQEDIKGRINALMKSGKIKSVAFQEFTVVK